MASLSRSKTFHYLPNLSTSDELYQSYLNKRSDAAAELKFYWCSCDAQFCLGCNERTALSKILDPLPARDGELLERGEIDDILVEERKVRVQPTAEERAEWHANCPMPDCKYRRTNTEEQEIEEEERGAENAHTRCPLVDCKYRKTRTAVGEVFDAEKEDGKETKRQGDVESAHKECPLAGCRHRAEWERKQTESR